MGRFAVIETLLGTRLTMGSRLALLYFLVFLAHGIAVPYFPVGLQALGYGKDWIGFLLAGGLVIHVLTPPLWGLFADHRGGGTPLIVAAAMAAIGLALIGLGGSVILGLALFYVGRSPLTPLLDAATLREEATGAVAFGQVRRWGSLGFLVAAVVGGLVIETTPPRSLFLGVAVLWGLLVILGRLPDAGRLDQPAIDWRDLVRAREIRPVLFAGALHFATHVPFQTHMAAWFLEAGQPGYWVSVAWLGGVGLEILVLSRLDVLIDRFGVKPLLLLSFTTGLFRWFVTGVLEPGPGVALIQTLHGISFGAFYGASVMWVDRGMPEHLRSSSQGLFSAVCFGLGGILGQLASGMLFEHLPGSMVFRIAGAVELVPIGIILCVTAPVMYRVGDVSRPNPGGTK